MTTTRLLFLCVIAALSSCSVLASSEVCTIDCLHNTKCARGKANFTYHPVKGDTKEPLDIHTEVERDGWHCACPAGLTGLRCAHTYENCNDGTHICYNGGDCIDTLKDIYQNDQLFCDCPAKMEGRTIRKFSGKYCEVEVDTNGKRCGDHGQNPCQNNGTCKHHVDEINPCDCPKGFTGKLCEYHQQSVPKCTLTCQNGGSCRYGTKESDENLTLTQSGNTTTFTIPVVHENFMYCECPVGFLGLQCETQSTVCGDIKCLHGSACVTIDNKDTGNKTYHCDCNAVNQEKLAKGEDVQFAGRHCEITSTSVCHYSDEETTFCAHNATCPDDSHKHCTCKEGYNGAHCQFKSQTLADPVAQQQKEKTETCKLQCKNGGNCRQGTKQDEHTQELIEKYGGELAKLGLDITHNQDFEHCACPTGYVGIECEYSMISCGKNGADHPCFHGSTCSMVENIPTCVCNQTTTASAGIFCQHLAKDGNVCDAEKMEAFTSNAEPVDDPMMAENRGFCVNGGICVKDKTGQSACRCHSAFEGPHCEFGKNSTVPNAATGTTSDSNALSSSQGRSGGAKFGIVVLVFMCVGALGAGFHVYQKRRAEGIEETGIAGFPPVYPDLDNSLALDEQSLRGNSGPMVDVGPERDYEGNELKNVELL